MRSATRSHQRAEVADIVKIWHGVPSNPEQSAIAAVLDRETARIDALVARKERLIELLQEKRTALITRAVTKGLDPNVPMKDSGVEWLGGIPAHWGVKRIRHVVRRVEQGWSPDCENREADEEEWGVLKAGCVNRGIFVESEHKALPAGLEPIPGLEIGPGDLLMSRRVARENSSALSRWFPSVVPDFSCATRCSDSMWTPRHQARSSLPTR